METMKYHIQGVAPLLMHNGQMAIPSNLFSKEISKISSKRKKVDADLDEMSRLEFLGGLYTVNGNIVIPGNVIEASLIGKGGAARKEKMGQQAASALFVMEDFPLIYDGAKDPDDLWKDKEFVHQAIVKIQRSSILRTRPVFKEWACDIEFEIDTEYLDVETVNRWVDVAGRLVGWCDWRPRYGRFTATKI